MHHMDATVPNFDLRWIFIASSAVISENNFFLLILVYVLFPFPLLTGGYNKNHIRNTSPIDLETGNSTAVMRDIERCYLLFFMICATRKHLPLLRWSVQLCATGWFIFFFYYSSLESKLYIAIVDV